MCICVCAVGLFTFTCNLPCLFVRSLAATALIERQNVTGKLANSLARRSPYRLDPVRACAQKPTSNTCECLLRAICRPRESLALASSHETLCLQTTAASAQNKRCRERQRVVTAKFNVGVDSTNQICWPNSSFILQLRQTLSTFYLTSWTHSDCLASRFSRSNAK